VGPEERPAFYVLAPGGWRDYWSLLHPPYTVWHLSYVVIGASTAPTVNLRWLGETLLAFLLGMGVAAHALDELNGRPLGTRIPSRVLVGLAVIGLAGAVALGIDGMVQVSTWLLLFIVVGAFLVLAYNLELLHGAFHSNLWFALAWGSFPASTAAFAQTGRVGAAAVLAALACGAISAAQRVLSTPVRELRRNVVQVDGAMTMRDGSTVPLDATALRAAPEAALRWLSLAMPILAGGLLVARLV
jgi:hypothetical protein